MAPVLNRQFYQSLSASRPSRTPHITPIRVTRYISLKVLIQLFVGTICIFVLAVLFWKVGKFFQFLTRDRVVRGGKTINTRYARTWYGWVPLQRHESNKKFFKKLFQKFRDWTAWKSSRADYRWVWWDPGQKEFERYKKRRRFPWLPKCFRSCESTPADTIWNPGPPVGHNPRPDEDAAGNSCALFGDISTRNVRRNSFKVSERLSSYNSPSTEESMTGYTQLPAIISTQFDRRFKRNSTTDTVRVRDLPIDLDYGRVSSTMRHSIYLRRGGCVVLFFPNRNRLLRHNFSMPCLLSREPAPRLNKGSDDSCTARTVEHGGTKPRSIQMRPCARVYQMWSARMEFQTSKCLHYNQRPLLGPPGSPNSELLGSFASERNVFLGAFPNTNRRSTTSLSLHSITHAMSTRRYLDEERTELTQIRHHDPEERSTRIKDYSSRSGKVRLPITQAPFPDPGDSAHSTSADRPQRLHNSDRSMKPRKINPSKRVKTKRSTHSKVAIASLSSWESRLVNDLNRKLEWLVNQLSPGRRPFHFALLANHWLNRGTWIVLDPISRVSIEAKRLLGDPRFNSPYPMPGWEPKLKYPETFCKIANKPHLNSWRVAVNRNRRATGLQGSIKSVSLYDGSADEPPDGKVDPASWILRRPPQGFAMSTKQRNAYYEGGAGWQETLGDWQRVRRGYRIRKAIYEGRANRTRIKQMAIGITRYCEMISSGVRKNTDQKATKAAPIDANNL